jgi:hypothetical protein
VISLDGYKLASSFWRKESLGGGVCILISNNIIFQTIDFKKFYHYETFETHPVKLHFTMIKTDYFLYLQNPSREFKTIL